MPQKPYAYCKSPGCPEKVTGGFCEEHKRKPKEYDLKFGTANSRGYDYSWQQLRDKYWRLHPLCEHCERDGRTTLATDIDHIVPIRVDPSMRLVWGNLQALCRACHDRKTREDGERWKT